MTRTLPDAAGQAFHIVTLGCSKNRVDSDGMDYLLRQRGMARGEALLKAGPTRLRPIVMTTVSVMAALLPIASGLEEGSELLVSVAVVLIGGLLTSTLLTLVFVPAMYTIFDDIQAFIVRQFQRVSKPRRLEPEEVAIAHPNGAQPTVGAEEKRAVRVE